MAKFSRVSLERKKELEKPDAILEFLQRASLWVSLHRRQTAIAAGAFLGVVILISGLTYFSARSEKIAFERLTQISRQQADGAEKSELTKAYRELNKKRGGTVAGEIAGLKYADACYKAGDYENAITAYQKAVSDFKGKDFLEIMAWNGLAYTYEAAGDYDRAISTFKQVLENPQSPIKDKALFNLGRLYERKGDTDSSRKMFDRITSDYPDSLYARIVKEGNAGFQSNS